MFKLTLEIIKVILLKKDLIDEFDKKILKENDWSNVGSIMQSLKGRAKFFSLRNKYYSEFIGEKRKIKQETHFHDTKVAEEIFDKNLYDLEEDLEKQLNYLENFLTYMRQRIIFLMQTKDIDFESGAEDKIDRIKDKTKEEIDIADNSNINFNSDFKNITIQSIKSLLDMFTCNYKGVKNIYRNPETFCDCNMYNEYSFSTLRNMTKDRFNKKWKKVICSQ